MRSGLVWFCSLLYLQHLEHCLVYKRHSDKFHSGGSAVIQTGSELGLMMMCVLSCVQLFAAPRTVVHLAPLSMGFFRQEYWSGFLLQGICPIQGLNPYLLCLLHCRWILYLLSHQNLGLGILPYFIALVGVVTWPPTVEGATDKASLLSRGPLSSTCVENDTHMFGAVYSSCMWRWCWWLHSPWTQLSQGCSASLPGLPLGFIRQLFCWTSGFH